MKKPQIIFSIFLTLILLILIYKTFVKLNTYKECLETRQY